MAGPHRVEIMYCTQCGWLPRAIWLAQELLATFDQELSEVALVPATGGVLEVRVDGAMVWSLKAEGGLPQPKELKRRVRDLVAPGRKLGHADR
ncbi:MAG: SelT/SelW/SelH family protein [Chloroflexi bacterium]|nr:SelT/SelW/SelH family protein [Chloroflexota bacterium]